MGYGKNVKLNIEQTPAYKVDKKMAIIEWFDFIEKEGVSNTSNTLIGWNISDGNPMAVASEDESQADVYTYSVGLERYLILKGKNIPDIISKLKPDINVSDNLVALRENGIDVSLSRYGEPVIGISY